MTRRFSSFRIPLLVMALLALPAFATEKAEEAEKPADNPYMKAIPKKNEGESKPKVYSNETLREMYGGAPSAESTAPATAPTGDGAAAPATPAAPPAGDPLKQLLDRERAREDHTKKIASAEARVAQAQAKLADMEKRRLAIRNPLLARPAAPEGEESQWSGMSGPERVARNEELMREAQADLQEARAELDALRRSVP